MAHPIDISVKTLIKTALVVIGFWLAYLISDILIVIAFAVIISSAVDHWASNLHKNGVPRTLGVILIYLIAIVLLASIFYLIIPLFLTQAITLMQDLPIYYNQITKYLGIDHSSAQSALIDKLQEAGVGLQDKLLAAGGGAFAFFKNIFSGIFSVVATFVLSFYLSLQENGVKRFLQFITPKEHEDYIADLWHRAERKLSKWMQGQIILGLIVGVIVYAGLSILGVPYALVLALLAAVLELIPVAGPIIAAIPAVALGFVVSPLTGLLTLGFYFIVQQMENHIIVPNVMRKTIGLNPAVVIIALLTGAKLGGIIGMLLAVPTATVLVEILKERGEGTGGELKI